VVAVMVARVFGQRDVVGQVEAALRACGQAVLDADPTTEDDRGQELDKLTEEWTRLVVPGPRETAGRQLWWALDDDDLPHFRAAIEFVLTEHTPRGSAPGTVPAERVAWSLTFHRYIADP
jgi:hypothetical protein